MFSQEINNTLNNNNTTGSTDMPITRSAPTRRYSLYLPDPVDIQVDNAESPPTSSIASGASTRKLPANGSPLDIPETASSSSFALPPSHAALIPSPLVAPTLDPFTPAEKRERELIFATLPHAPRAASTHDLRWAYRAPRRTHEGPPEGPWTTWYCHRCGLRKDFPVAWLNTWRWELRCDDPINGCNYDIFYKKRSKNVLLLSTD